ncbi:MAG: hypothetical protein IKJ94_02635 [Oscillospiraceae bacterium]|nr:hypothetical protein [Oscillospiraceae bacterium]
MKKLLCFVLTAALVFSLAGCGGYHVPSPMAYPDYTFEETPDTMQLRQMAVQAMRDLLTIQWHTETDITYRKTGPVNGKQFHHEPGKTYGGMFYSGASSGLFQFLEYYDSDTGCLRFPGNSNDLKSSLGSSCADTLLWAWSTVCNSFTGGYYPIMMVPKNGYCTVGDYKLIDGIKTFYEYPSYAVIRENGNAVMLEAYAQMLPADALVTNSDNHAMMVIEAPTVVYLPDGSIDSANSFVMIQDQRAGGKTFYEHNIDGHTVYLSGRIDGKYTFDKLLEEHYIPVTTEEFLGLKEYDKAQVSASTVNPDTWEDLLDSEIIANYPLAVVNTYLVEADGNHVLLDKKLFGGYADTGVPTSCKISEIDTLSRLDKSKCGGCTLEFEVVVSTGERFVPIEFTF